MHITEYQDSTQNFFALVNEDNENFIVRLSIPLLNNLLFKKLYLPLLGVSSATTLHTYEP